MVADLNTNATLRIIIRLLLDMPENAVRPSDQNAPIVKGEEYITVQITAEHAEGTDETEWLDDDALHATEHISGVRLVSASIQYYNGDAYRQLRSLSSRLQSELATQMFSDAGFGFVAVANVTNLTGLLPDEIWQSRAVMRLDFYVAVDDLVRTPLIVTVPITIYPERGEPTYKEVEV
jgi:hypothetical protein